MHGIARARRYGRDCNSNADALRSLLHLQLQCRCVTLAIVIVMQMRYARLQCRFVTLVKNI